MNRQNSTFLSAAIVGSMCLSSSAFAKTAEECAAEWRAGKVETQTGDASEMSYVDQCRQGGASLGPKPTTTVPGSNSTSEQIGGVSSRKTAKDCDDQWRADQVSMMAHGMTEDSYVEQCLEG